MSTPNPHNPLADLTWLNIGDICTALGVGPGTPLRGLVELACRPAAQRFARQILHLDQLVGVGGLPSGSSWICAQLSDGLLITGERPPAQGSLLVVANHPGLLDAAALASAIGRPDLRVLAIMRPFLRSLPNIATQLFAVGPTPGTRMAAVRAASRHLRAGGALLTFPAGRIEPDPVSMGGAENTLVEWSTSLELITRLAQPLTVVPAIVGGVISPEALHHPLTRLRRTAADRQWLAAILQLGWPALRRHKVRVAFGRPVAAHSQTITPIVHAEARRVISSLSRGDP